ncbi:ATP-binding protein [Prescottella agglutinans]|uniref:DNA polymerase III delta prime subunit n=1 Tax=Prescottella agglutinans TaxID=1644129 RepID=A0ABT6M7T4_9NOCA|nr:ATP-binding protein [Prescottella agglutinans]MDH6279489.1 DNA polymerase III delta prime subunit [Prescottella agglutinans]
MIEFKPATKAASKARIALCGPSGSGKTYTALALASSLSDRVAVIDTERGSASKYVGINGWQFDTVTPDRYSPLSLVETLGVAAGVGFGVVVIDSLSHYWMGTDGMLEQVDRRSGSNKFTSGWKEVGPEEKRMIDAILTYPGHVVATLRTKTEYVIQENERGKKEPKKVGTKPIQRDGIEYEFDVIGDLDLDNRLSISKTRIPSLARAVIPEPGHELAQTIREWLDDGVERRSVEEWRNLALAEDATAAGLLELYRSAERDQMLGAPTTTDDGQPTVLGDLISGRGRRLRDAESAAEPAATQDVA